MLTKQDLLGLVKAAKGVGYAVWAPVRRDDMVLLERIEEAGSVDLNHVLTVNTLKDVLLPRYEPLARFDLDSRAVDPVSDPEDRVLILGNRPCDAAGMDILDSILLGEVRDKRYADRRERTVIVTVACSSFDEACFCSSMGYGPHDTTGSDVLLLPKGDAYLVRTITKKGRNLLAELSILEDVDAEADPPPELTRAVDTEGLKAWLDSNFDDPKWQGVSENCISCGTCYYLCPTCHCFDIADEAGISRGERLRIWDCCSFSGFTRMASHQPRVGRHARYRQRVMHKFKYTVDNVDRVACVGDGRCIRHCPTGVDICEILESLTGKE
jgi:sulfhydrogenase subunit beta (sulfur reductase)